CSGGKRCRSKFGCLAPEPGLPPGRGRSRRQTMFDSEADFVVVGAGSAGCVVAARLSEDSATQVALLEAGGWDRNPWIHIPVGFFKTIFNPDLTWGYQTDPIPGLDGRVMNWPRGKVIGGSSSINGLLYTRGQPEDYDHWRQLGNVG